MKRNVNKRLQTLILTAASREEGEGFVDVLVKMLIVVVVGAALLGAMSVAVPELFNSMVETIRAKFVV